MSPLPRTLVSLVLALLVTILLLGAAGSIVGCTLADAPLHLEDATGAWTSPAEAHEARATAECVSKCLPR